jgi:hypothetical protein
MLIGIGRVFWGIVATAAMYVVYAVVLPIVVMFAVLMICRYIPLAGWTRKSDK